MGLWDKIKNFFNRGKNETKALPEGSSNSVNPYQQGTTLYRRDGSSVLIIPKSDRVGNPMFKAVLNHNTGEMQYIPEYTIADQSLSNAKTIHGTTITSILMDVDSKLLQDETYSYYIAEVLLAPERLTEVVDNNMHYAGGINIEESGRVAGCYSDPGIIQGLQANQLENQQRYEEYQKARNEEYIKEITENAESQGVNIKTSHAQKLTPDMYQR